MNDIFWWLHHDWLKYKVPVHEGKVLIPEHYLTPGFQPDTREIWYSFVKGRKDPRQIADFSGMDESVFFVNEKAYAIFEKLFLKHGRAYKVWCSNLPHYLVLIDTLHDAFDSRRSKFDRSYIEKRVEDDISRFFKVVLRNGFRTEDDIFRLAGSFALNGVMIVSDNFRRRYEESGLTGLYFSPTGGSE